MDLRVSNRLCWYEVLEKRWFEFRKNISEAIFSSSCSVKMSRATFALLAFALLATSAKAAPSNGTSITTPQSSGESPPSSGESPPSSGESPTPTSTPRTGSNDDDGKQKGQMWSELSQKQRDCIRDKWAKEGESIKEAAKLCHEKKGGPDCMKDIAQLKPCFA